MTSTAVVPWGDSPRDPPRDSSDEELRAKEERWHEAWRRNQLGESTRTIARKMGISQPTAHRYIRRWERLVAGSLSAMEERDHQIALLSELEKLNYREAADGYTTWVAATGAIRAVMADKRDLLGISSTGKQGNGTAGVGQPDAGAGAELPGAVAGALTRLRVVT